MLARCCGKTDVHNLEPEDLRSLSVETAQATGVPLVGCDMVIGLFILNLLLNLLLNLRINCTAWPGTPRRSREALAGGVGRTV